MGFSNQPIQVIRNLGFLDEIHKKDWFTILSHICAFLGLETEKIKSLRNFHIDHNIEAAIPSRISLAFFEIWQASNQDIHSDKLETSEIFKSHHLAKRAQRSRAIPQEKNKWFTFSACSLQTGHRREATSMPLRGFVL